jgi:hypothetical protein
MLLDQRSRLIVRHFGFVPSPTDERHLCQPAKWLTHGQVPTSPTKAGIEDYAVQKRQVVDADLRRHDDGTRPMSQGLRCLLLFMLLKDVRLVQPA